MILATTYILGSGVSAQNMLITPNFLNSCISINLSGYILIILFHVHQPPWSHGGGLVNYTVSGIRSDIFISKNPSQGQVLLSGWVTYPWLFKLHRIPWFWYNNMEPSTPGVLKSDRLRGSSPENHKKLLHLSCLLLLGERCQSKKDHHLPFELLEMNTHWWTKTEN